MYNIRILFGIALFVIFTPCFPCTLLTLRNAINVGRGTAALHLY